MRVTIEYCVQWNYEPRASRLEASVRDAHADAEVELIPSSGGVFEVTRDGELVYSKKATGRHTSWEEIEPLLERGS